MAARAKREHDRLAREFERKEAEAAEALGAAVREREEARAELDAMPRRGRPSKRKLEPGPT